MPKSSSAMSTPISASCRSGLSRSSSAPMSADSVTSRQSAPGSSPDRSSTSTVSATSRGWCSWVGERLTLIRSGPPSVCRFCQKLACRTDSSSTQRPSGTISPVCSASGMNRSGPSTPCCGWHHRTSASAPCTVPSSRCTSGWYSMKNSPRSSAAGSAVVSPWRVMARASASSSANSNRLPPADLARYMVMSALRSTSAALRSRACPSTTPMDPRTVSSRPSRRIGVVSTPRMRQASSTTSVSVSGPVVRATNSSPPSRATISPRAVAQLCSRSATSTSSRSPDAWPRLSLIALKPSRSR